MSAPDEAVALKKKGNEAFAKHEWLNAIDFYTKAIASYSQDPVFYCNRCQVYIFHLSYLLARSIDFPLQAHIKLEQYGYAIADATKAIELDKTYAKVKASKFLDLAHLLTFSRHSTGGRSQILPYSSHARH